MSQEKEGMVNVTSKRCCENGCKTQPLYNRESETKGLYCAAHKKEGMVDVKNKKCCEEACKKHPIYNHESETKGLFTKPIIKVVGKTICCPRSESKYAP